jgi:hypothetical protein
MADLFDAAGSYLTNRFSGLQDRYNNVASMFGGPQRDEEEDSANVKPVTQTVTTDPTTGDQTMTIKGRPEDLSAANPYTPTVTMPGQGLRMPTQPQDQGIQMPQREMTDVTMPAFTAPAAPGAPAPVAPTEQFAAAPGAPVGKPVEAPADTQADDMYQQLVSNMQQQQGQPQPRPIAAVAQAPATSDVNPPAVTAPAVPAAEPVAAAPTAPTAPTMSDITPGAPMRTEEGIVPAPAAQRPAMPGGGVQQVPGQPPTGLELTARMESGSNPNIGYHNPALSDAYGKYGITSKAYSDVQKRDPYFTGRDITTLTPEEQDRAAMVVRKMNSQELINQGLEATEANIQLAHFLGPRGAAEYLRTGYISPEAAEANGGYAKTDQLAREKLAAGGGDANAAPRTFANANAENPREQQLNQSTNLINDAYNNKDEKMLYRLAISDDPQVSGPAKAKIKLLDQERAGQARADQLIASGKTTDLARHLNDRGDGNWVKYYLLTRLGLTDAAKEEAQKLGAGTKMTSLSDTGGKQYSAEVDGDGIIRKAWDADGNAITSKKTLANLQASALQKGERGLATGTRVRDDKNKEWSQVPTSRGMVFYDNAGNRGVPSGKTVPIGIGSDVQLQGQLQTQKKQIDLAWDPIIKAATTSAEGLVKYNQQYGTNFSIAGTAAGGTPIIVDNNTGTIVKPNASGRVTGTQATGGTPGTTGPLPNASASETTVINQRAMNKDIQDNIVPAARQADAQVNSITEILNVLKQPNAEKVFGIYNDVMAGTDARAKKLFTDVIAGKVVAGSPEYEEFRKRFSELGLGENEVGILRRIDALSASSVGASVRELTGTIGISNQDVKVAQRNNVNPAEWPMLAAYSQWHYQRFEGDLKRARSDWAAENMGNFPNSAAMDKAWRSESAAIKKDNEAVAEARAKYLEKFNNLQPREKAAKIREAYDLFPSPRYEDGTWNNRKAKPLSSFVR